MNTVLIFLVLVSWQSGFKSSCVYRSSMNGECLAYTEEAHSFQGFPRDIPDLQQQKQDLNGACSGTSGYSNCTSPTFTQAQPPLRAPEQGSEFAGRLHVTQDENGAVELFSCKEFDSETGEVRGCKLAPGQSLDTVVNALMHAHAEEMREARKNFAELSELTNECISRLMESALERKEPAPAQKPKK